MADCTLALEVGLVDPTLDVRVDGSPGAVPARAFVDAVKLSLDLLDQLERAEYPNARPAGQWLIAELRNSSAVASLHRPEAPELQTPRRLVEGVRGLRSQQELPPFFSAEVADGLARIGKLLHQPGISGVSFSTRSHETSERTTEQLTETVVGNALASIEGSNQALGSVTGVLDVINLRRGQHRVSLYDADTRRAVQCRFPDDLFETMRTSLGRRIRVLGVVTRNARGQILRVEITDVEELPEAPAVPSVDELAGIAPWYTGDQSTEDYLRSVRGA